MNFFEKVTSLIRCDGRLEDLGRGLARVLDQGHLIGFVLYGAPERCLVTVPYRPPDAVDRLRDAFERADWRGRPREAFLEAFEGLEIPTGEIGEAVRWAFLGSEDDPIGAFACVRDPAAPPPPETERKMTDFFFQLAGEVAVSGVRRAHQDREGEEREYLLDVLNQVGRLMLERPDRSRLLPALLKIALDVARTEVGSILLERDGRFATEIEWGLPGELIDGIRFLPEGQGLVERLRETLEPVIVDDFSGPTVRLPDGFPVRIASLVAVPLLAGDRLAGILNVASGEDGRELLPSTVTALTTVAGLMTTAVENVRLAEALAARAEEAHQGLAEEQNLLRQVLAGLPDGVLVSDPAGRIVLANPAAEEMLGLGGAPDRRFPDRNVVTLRPFFAWLRDRWSAATAVEEARFRLDVKPPSVLAARIVPLATGGDRASHMTVIREARPDGEAAGRPPGIGAIVSELETPLAVLRIALALRGSAGEAGRGFADRMAGRGIGRLVALAEDLRDEALIAESRLDLDLAEFPLGEAAAIAFIECRDAVEEKRIACRGPLAGDLLPVLADRRRLPRALARILVAAVDWAADDGWMAIEVSRTSEGAAISVGFLQAPAAAGFETAFDEPAALPVGLAVALRVIGLHGGRIAARSEKDVEASLTVELPLAGCRLAPAPRAGERDNLLEESLVR